MSPLRSVAGPLGKGPYPQLRPLQVDQDADRPSVFELDRADRGDEFAHAIVRGVTHVDAEHVGAGAKQVRDGVAVA